MHNTIILCNRSFKTFISLRKYYGTNKVDEQKIENSVQDLFDLSPKGIREHLKLTNPIYVPTSSYGHFGREPTDQGHFSWEKTDLVDSLKSLL